MSTSPPFEPNTPGKEEESIVDIVWKYIEPELSKIGIKDIKSYKAWDFRYDDDHVKSGGVDTSPKKFIKVKIWCLSAQGGKRADYNVMVTIRNEQLLDGVQYLVDKVEKV